jgi:hypothetical protein
MTVAPAGTSPGSTTTGVGSGVASELGSTVGSPLVAVGLDGSGVADVPGAAVAGLVLPGPTAVDEDGAGDVLGEPHAMTRTATVEITATSNRLR